MLYVMLYRVKIAQSSADIIIGHCVQNSSGLDGFTMDFPPPTPTRHATYIRKNIVSVYDGDSSYVLQNVHGMIIYEASV